MRVSERPELLVEFRAGAGPLLLDFVQLAIDPSQRILEGLHEIGDRLVPSVQIDARGLLKLSKLGLGEVQERAVVAFECLVRERRESFPQARFPGSGGLALRLELRAKPGTLLLGAR